MWPYDKKNHTNNISLCVIHNFKMNQLPFYLRLIVYIIIFTQNANKMNVVFLWKINILFLHMFIVYMWKIWMRDLLQACEPNIFLFSVGAIITATTADISFFIFSWDCALLCVLPSDDNAAHLLFNANSCKINSMELRF